MVSLFLCSVYMILIYVHCTGIAGYVPTQRLEWKRYKQYTRSDIMAAIEEVKKGKPPSSLLFQKMSLFLNYN